MEDNYDIGIAGGGPGGLALAIQLARAGHKVIVFEKERYPLHRVCGEYISMESWDFLQHLGLNLEAMHVLLITHLQLSTKNGKLLEQKLPLGGFSLSRYVLDDKLAQLARTAGVTVMENTRVNDIRFTGNGFVISTSQEFHVKVAAGSFGKRSNLDIKWKRPFAITSKSRLNNYVGIKYHIRHAGFPPGVIALHVFDNGYCGMVRLENDSCNLCYLTTADNLQKSGGIPQMEQTILSQNPHLRQLLEESEKCEGFPVTISQISFDQKKQVEDHVLMIGDAGGMITPLCGNGISMALHASKLAAGLVDSFLTKNISRNKMEEKYLLQWQDEFASRLRIGRAMQRLLASRRLTNLVMECGVRMPSLIKWMIRKTHGEPY